MKTIIGSHACSKSELDLFYSLPTNTSIISSNYTNISLQKISGDENSFEINVPGTDEYTDLSDIYLKLELSIEKDNTKITQQDNIGPINNFGHSLFKKIELKIGAGLNRKLVEVGNSHYAYKSYLLNLLNFGFGAKNTWLQSALFHKDTHSEFENTNIDFETKHVIKTEGTQSKNINISESNAHISALQISPAKYPIKQNKIIATSIDNDSKDYNISNFGHIIPSKMIFGLVEDEAYSGSFKTNPYCFKAFNLEKITLIIDNVSKVININQDANDYSEAYHALCEGLNMYGVDGNDISLSEFGNGNCLFFFNLCPDKGYCEQYNVIKSGSIQVKLEF